MPTTRRLIGPTAAFTIAEGAHHGLTPTTMRAAVWTIPHAGIRVAESSTQWDVLAALLRALPAHAFFCGPTAAVLHGLPLPYALDNRVGETAHRSSRGSVPDTSPRHHRSGSGGRARRHRRGPWHPVHFSPQDVGGTRRNAGSRAADGHLGSAHLAPSSDATRKDLERMHRRFLGGRGSKRRRLAVDLADERAESPRESELRVLLIQSGLPVPQSNVEIFDGSRFVARVDLLYPDERLIIEYDGDHHRDPHQWSRDQSRRAELESLGYRMTVVTARDFDDPVALLACLRRLLARTPA